MLWTPHYFVSFFVVVLGGVVFRLPNNLEKNLGNIIFSHFDETYTAYVLYWNKKSTDFKIELSI
jgi:hypothetical protein